MGRLIPEDIEIGGDINVNVNLNIPHPERISSSINNLIWTACLASIARSWFRKK